MRPRSIARFLVQPWFAVVLALCLSAPALFVGLSADDVPQRQQVLAHLHDPDAPGHFWDLYDAGGRGGPVDVAARVYAGLLPWWTSPHFSLAFFRPLAALSHYLDYALWPDSPWAMHLHNLLWYALVVALAGALYRTLLGPGVPAALALGLYAIDEAHIDGAAWIAGRNTLMGSAFALLAVLCFVRARQRGSGASALCASVCVLLGLASNEGAIALFGYLFAYALCLDRARRGARLLSLFPPLLLALGYGVLAHALGYGARGSGVYVDPRSDPWLFARVALVRLPEVLRAQLGLPLELERLLSPAAQSASTLAGYLLLALAVVPVLALARERKTARFFALGMLASAVPLCSAGAEPRILFLLGFGTHGLIAELLFSVFAARKRLLRPAGVPALTVAACWFCLHGPLALVVGPLTPSMWTDIDHALRRAAASLPARPGLDAVMVLNTPSYLMGLFAQMYRPAVRPAAPAYMPILAAGTRGMQVSRRAPRVLVLEPEGGFLREPTSLLVRSPDERFAVGQHTALLGASVEVERVTPDGRPARVALTTALDASDPRIAWIAWDAERERFAPVALPPVGGRLVL